MFYSITRVDWYRWWKRGRTGACSSLAMVAWRHCMEVRQPLLATARPGKKRTGSMVTTQTYRGYLGGVGNTDEVRPRARWCGSESAEALAIVFCADEATIHRSVTP